MGVAQRKDRKIDARTRICRAGLAEFATKGFDGANLVSIAADAEVSQPNIHYHFKTKLDLWRAAMLYLGQTLERDRETLRCANSLLDPLAQLKLATLGILETAARSPEFGRIILAEGQVSSERLEWLMNEVFGEFYAEYLELINRCIADGLIKPYRPHHIVMLLHGAAVTQFNVAPLVANMFAEDVREPDNVAAFRKLYLDVIFSGLIAAPKEG
ncbi:MAG: TetR/AcrR family transcriptional regulator [Pseudomonadota bacterium]